MVVYNFKSIAVVPSQKDFIDVILSKTQRKTPTVVHQGYAISRIRKFYMRKVKYTQQNYRDKLTQILDEFPRLDDIHPFYADLINVLYSRDHYKLALGQLNTARTLIDNLGKDYLRLLKFADSLYRCKELKRAGLGRMCTVMKKLGPSLSYLEQVRQHLSRLPSIDPNTRTLMITGYPNVGKSSFINKVSQANVEVQPYAFTTKSLFVGHCHYKYVRWQVIDTPGILDHPLEDRNTIEMQAITALAHLHATVLFFIDISEQCGYTIKQQTDLFHSIKPLFANKPLLIVANKIDLKKMEDLDPEDKARIEGMTHGRQTQIIPMSNVSEAGINQVMSTGCDMLLQHRVEKKLKSKRVGEIINRIHVAQPVPRDNKVRGTSIPESVLAARAVKSQGIPQEKRKTEKDLELENGGPGIFNHDHKKLYTGLENDEWKYDIIPEIMDGKNIADFIDPDIEKRLAELEAEEEEWERQHASSGGDGMMDDDDSGSDLDDDTKDVVEQIRTKKKIIIQQRRLQHSNNKPIVPRQYKPKSLDEVKEGLAEVGLSSDHVLTRSRSRTREPLSKKRRHSQVDMDTTGEGDVEMDGSMTRSASTSRTRSKSRDHKRGPSKSPFRNVRQKLEAEKLTKVHQRSRNRDARQGESDRRVFNEKPKHLFSGKRGIGKTDRR